MPASRLSMLDLPVDLAPQTDVSLMVRVEQHHHDALAELFSRHHEAVRRSAWRTCGGSLADDVVQEVFLNLWEHPARFDPSRGTLRSYLLTSAHGRSVDLLRNHAARVRRETGRGSHLPALVGAPADRGHEVRELLTHLPAAQRDTLVLAYFQGHSYAEVAALLDLPLGRSRAGSAPRWPRSTRSPPTP